MNHLKIRVFEIGGEEPEAVITIPLNVARVAKKLIPDSAMSAMQEEGIDLAEVLELVEKEDVRGVLVEVERKGKKVVVAVE